MLIYNFNSTTFEFTYSELAELDPVGGEPMIPGNSTTVPVPTAPLTNAVYCFNKSTGSWIIQADYRNTIWYDPATKDEHPINDIGITPDPLWVDVMPADTVDEVAAGVLELINFNFEIVINTIKAGYSQSEVETWNKQEVEARAYVADPAANIPFVTNMANARGITVDAMVAKIIAKADLYVVALGGYVGKRQKYEDDINAVKADVVMTDAEKIAALTAIVWV